MQTSNIVPQRKVSSRNVKINVNVIDMDLLKAFNNIKKQVNYLSQKIVQKGPI